MTTEREKTMPPVKKNIWELNIGNIITMLVIIVTMSISYAKTEERVNTQAEISRLNFETINKAIIRIEKNIDDIQNVLGGSNYPLRDERIAQLFRELEEIKKHINR